MKRITYIIAGLLAISIAIAGISISQVDKTVDKDIKALLDAKAQDAGLDKFPSYTVPELNCTDTECELIKIDVNKIGTMLCNIERLKMIVDKDTGERTYLPYSDEELLQQLDECQDDWLKNVAESQKDKQEKSVARTITEAKEVNIK